eukprot:TRINITY_DN16112_c0_g1_i1.p1 TRINITY_DN16112_c0_g1~~TRINITY_DN16112_c0_g1_i1.p1  ORF type:complete len:152 (+),score=43.54 TRINITY_DN16112_c0_g1_i1:57-512(+)
MAPRTHTRACWVLAAAAAALLTAARRRPAAAGADVLRRCDRTAGEQPASAHAAVTAGRRAVVVGDPHGCVAELQEVLAKAGFSPSDGDVAVVTGDLVGKGPNSSAVVRLVRSTPGLYSVRGNHDVWALQHPAASGLSLIWSGWLGCRSASR